MKLFYSNTEKSVNKGFLVFGLVLLVFQIIGVVALTNTLIYLPDNLFTEYLGLAYVYGRVLTLSVISLIGTVFFLKLRQVGWYLLCSVFTLRLAEFRYDLAFQSVESLTSVIMPVTDLFLLIYLFFGRPITVFQVDKRKRLIPLIVALLIFLIEKVLLILIMK